MRFRLTALLCFLTHLAHAEPRRIPFWPDAVPQALRDAVDGNAALEAVRQIGRFHRVQGSPGFAAAADWVAAQLAAGGLADAHVEHFAADGKARYGTLRSYYGWVATDALLEEPGGKVWKRFPQQPISLASYSSDADVTAALVDVGDGTGPADYAGRDVRGKIVLANGPVWKVQQLAITQHGAAGIASAAVNQETAWSGEDPDQVRWGNLAHVYDAHATGFAFMFSRREAGQLRERLRRGEAIKLHARVRARPVPASYDVVAASIPGTDPAAGDLVVTAHLCHPQPGANDNASGSAAALELARALARAIREGKLAAPRRTIRFLLVPEMSGSQAWLLGHPDLARRLRAGVHFDMVGGLVSTIRGSLHISRSVESLPHVINEITRAFLDEVTDASARYAEGLTPQAGGFVWPPGSREALFADLRRFEVGSDHQIFQDSTFAVPMVYFHDWPDPTIHTDKDVPANLDATKLGRVAYLGAGIVWTLAALPDGEAERLVAYTRSGIDEHLARVRRQALGSTPEDAALVDRESAAIATATLDSLAALWPTTRDTVAKARRAYAVKNRPRKPADARVPVRTAAAVGPVNPHYWNAVADQLGDYPPPRLEQRDEALCAEALNFADGRRTFSEIRDLLTGRYQPVPLAEVVEYFELLAKAGLVRF